VRTAAVLYLCGGLVRLLLVAFPISPTEPTGLLAAVGSLCCMVSVMLWIFAWRVPTVALQILMVAGTLLVSLLVANATTGRGVVLAAFAYPWVIVYGAHFFSRRMTLALAGLVSVSFAVALSLNGLPGGAFEWLLVSLTVFAGGIVLSKLSESLHRQADTDYLTGLLNRGGFLSAATRERAIADRGGAPLAVAVIDLDDFKQVNDRGGHAAGDRLLESLAHGWQEHLRAGDILARHGGDEFVLLLPATTAPQANRVLDRMRAANIGVNWSAGVSEWLAGESLDDCLARADKYLYAVKQSLRSRPQHPQPGRPVSLVSSI
jgi:diguanylate cyclase (GGDEF)-like protein